MWVSIEATGTTTTDPSLVAGVFQAPRINRGSSDAD
jgi:hypothetical protein